MRVEIEFSTDRPYDNTPEFRERAHGGPPGGHISPSTPSPDRIATKVGVNKVAVVLEGLGLDDVPHPTRNNFIAAFEGNIPNCTHARTREVSHA